MGTLCSIPIHNVTPVFAGRKRAEGVDLFR